MNKKTQLEAENIFLKQGLTLIEKYIDNKTPVSCCDEFGYKYTKRLSDLARDVGSNKFHKSNPYSIDNIKNYIKIHNINCEILSTNFPNATDKLSWKCSCGNIFDKSWNDISNIAEGKFCCPTCGYNNGYKKRTKTHEDFCKEVNLLNEKILVISKYVGVLNNIKCKCKIHNVEFEGLAINVLCGKVSCPVCKSIKMSKTHEEFCAELSLSNPNIEPLETYNGLKNKIKCMCKIHHYAWYASPEKILYRKTGCPKCASYHNENVLDDILNKWNIKFNIQKIFKDCKDKNVLPFDRYLKDFKILIEYDGEGHYKPIRRGKMNEYDAVKQFELVQKHDDIKTKYCKTKNIPLIRIPYWEKDDMEYFLFNELVKYGAIEELNIAN